MFFHVRCGCAVVLEVHECFCVGSVVMSACVGVRTGLSFVSPRVSNSLYFSCVPNSCTRDEGATD